MQRSEITIDLGAVRHNARRLLEALDGAELWAVVKANGYGHGATDVARAALEAGASALCVVTVPEALELRRELPEARIVVMCPTDELAEAREAKLELVVSGGEIPGRDPRASEARHRHGTVGARRAAGAAGERGGADEPPRDRRLRPGVRARASRALPRGDRAVLRTSPATSRTARPRSACPRPASTPPAAGSRSTGSRRSTRIRPRTGCGRRSRGGAESLRCACSSPVRAPATAAASSPSARPGSGSCPSATPTGSGAT